MYERERIATSYRRLLDQAPAANLPPFRLVFPDGSAADVGHGPAAFSMIARDAEGLAAVAALDALGMCEAFMAEHLDVRGDLLAAARYVEVLGDTHPWISVWRRLQPALLGRERVNPAWIAKHYDSGNANLYMTEREYDTYTPGQYDRDGDSLEVGAERKLGLAFEQLGLRRGDRLLDVGCGWGGMIRYAARRGVRVTGITLSRDQYAYDRDLIAREKLDAEVHYQDFFTFAPPRPFDGVSMMGVIEDLSDYRRVVRGLERLVAPGKRVYLDFGASRTRFGTHTFVTKYVWPGTFRLVYMPELVEAIRESPFELSLVTNDRRNYHVWCAMLLRRWEENRARVEAEHGARLWRTFALLLAGTSAMMDFRSHAVTAYRVVLELPADTDRSYATPNVVRAVDGVRAAAGVAREAALRAWQRLGGALPHAVPPVQEHSSARDGAASPWHDRPATRRPTEDRAPV
jgi:cyclopropane-fatty-acyl-phospholipid synthase